MFIWGIHTLIVEDGKFNIILDYSMSDYIILWLKDSYA